MLDYPYFVDVRGAGKNTSFADHVRRAAGHDAVGVADRRRCDEEQRPHGDRSAEEFAGELAIDVDGRDAANRLGTASRRSRRKAIAAHRCSASASKDVQSFFADKENPLVADVQEPRSPRPMPTSRRSAEDKKPATTSKSDAGVIGSIIDKSPESARLFVFGSNTFLSDQTLWMIGSAEGTVYGNSLQMIANAVDWSLEDRDAARDPFARTFQPHAAAARGITAHVRSSIRTTARARAARD